MSTDERPRPATAVSRTQLRRLLRQLEPDDPSPSRSAPGLFLVFAGVAVAILLLWVGYGVWLIPMLENPSPARVSSMYGGLDALFSGLAFAGVLCAVWLQSRQLRSQLRELRTAQSISTMQSLFQVLVTYSETEGRFGTEPAMLTRASAALKPIVEQVLETLEEIEGRNPT